MSRTSPSDPLTRDIKRLLGSARKAAASGQTRSAAQFARETLLLDPSNVKALYFLGFADPRPRRRLALAKRIFPLARTSEDFLFVADICLYGGDKTGGKAALLMGMCLSPTDGRTLGRLARFGSDTEDLKAQARNLMARPLTAQSAKDVLQILHRYNNKPHASDVQRHSAFLLRVLTDFYSSDTPTFDDRLYAAQEWVSYLGGNVFVTKHLVRAIVGTGRKDPFPELFDLARTELVKSPASLTLLMGLGDLLKWPNDFSDRQREWAILSLHRSRLLLAEVLPTRQERIEKLAHGVRITSAFDQRNILSAKTSTKVYRFSNGIAVAPSPESVANLRIHAAQAQPNRLGFFVGSISSLTAKFFAPGVIRAAARSGYICTVYTTSPADSIPGSPLNLLAENLPITISSLDSLDLDGMVRLISADLNFVYIDMRGYGKEGLVDVLRAHPARVTAYMIGSCETAGISNVDALIADPWLIPTDRAPFLEKNIVQLGSGLLNFSADDLPKRTKPRRADGGLRFGAFHQMSKMSSFSIDLWSAALKAVPSSSLHLKLNSLEHPAALARLGELFEARKIARDRIKFVLRTETHEEHIQEVEKVDVMLDAAPFNGETTTLETLWMGVPVVSIVGNRMIARFGHSILNSCGLGHLCADSVENFGAIARKTITDPEWLSDFRENGREALQQSPTFNADAYAPHVEKMVRDLVAIGLKAGRA